MNKKKLIIGGSAAGVILVAAIFGFVFLKGHSSGSSDSGVCGFCDIDHGTWKRYRTAEPFRRCGGAAENGDDQTVIRQKGKRMLCKRRR